MIDFYTAGTPNGYKPAIMLEEIGLPYSIHKVDISQGDQFSPEYIEINPNSKIPAIIDREADISVFESGAVLIYLAEKTGKLLREERVEPKQSSRRSKMLEFTCRGRRRSSEPPCCVPWGWIRRMSSSSRRQPKINTTIIYSYE